MKNYTLGLNIYHADASACIFENGKLICAYEEERLNRTKHWSGIPLLSIKKCLEISNISINHINKITVNTNPASNKWQKFKYFFTSKNKINNFKSFFERQKKKLLLKDEIEKFFNTRLKSSIIRFDHHLCHTAVGFYSSGFKDSLCLSIDGFGDFSSCLVSKCSEKGIRIIKKVFYPHSIGVFYEGMTQFLGFKNYGDEYKVMGLSAYGKPKYHDKIRTLISYDNDKLFELNMKYYCHDKPTFSYQFDGEPKSTRLMYEDKLYNLLNLDSEKIKNFDVKADIACSVQKVFEEIIFKILNKYNNFFPDIKNLVITGGCAMNSLANGKITCNTNFKNVFVPFAPGDNGGSIGSAILQNLKNLEKKDLTNPYIGIRQKIDEDNIKKQCLKKNFYCRSFETVEDCNKFIAKKISDTNIVARFNNNMEFGSRALGNTSILCDPRLKNAKDIINSKVKLRESFRPFAPSILEDKSSDWFENQLNSPYMSFVLKIKEEKRKLIPAVCHIDGTGRLQTVKKNINYSYYDLIREFEKITKIPILLNTSFNENEPIIYNWEEALATFGRTEIDYLTIENLVVSKNVI